MRAHPILLLSLLILCGESLRSQEIPSRHAVPGHVYLKEYWGRPELYLQHQSRYLLDLAGAALDANPPSLNPGRERDMALAMVDAVLHEPAPMDSPEVLRFLATRAEKVADDLANPLKIRKDAVRIYKVYNCGLLFRTRQMTVAVDLNGRDGRLVPDSLMERIVDQVDIVFYTHNHGDHTDTHVRDFCHRKGIPVYAPDEVFRKDSLVHHIRPDGIGRLEIDLPAGELDVRVLPGHQDALQNNIWVLTLPNGRTVCATGDQWQDDGSDLAWLKDIHRELPAIDILAMDCWIHDFEEHLADFRPRLLVSQHENEIGAHGIDHREAFWMTRYKNDRIYDLPVPYVLMAWGEWFDWR